MMRALASVGTAVAMGLLGMAMAHYPSAPVPACTWQGTTTVFVTVTAPALPTQLNLPSRVSKPITTTIFLDSDPSGHKPAFTVVPALSSVNSLAFSSVVLDVSDGLPNLPVTVLSTPTNGSPAGANTGCQTIVTDTFYHWMSCSTGPTLTTIVSTQTLPLPGGCAATAPSDMLLTSAADDQFITVVTPTLQYTFTSTCSDGFVTTVVTPIVAPLTLTIPRDPGASDSTDSGALPTQFPGGGVTVGSPTPGLSINPNGQYGPLPASGSPQVLSNPSNIETSDVLGNGSPGMPLTYTIMTPASAIGTTTSRRTLTLTTTQTILPVPTFLSGPSGSNSPTVILPGVPNNNGWPAAPSGIYDASGHLPSPISPSQIIVTLSALDNAPTPGVGLPNAYEEQNGAPKTTGPFGNLPLTIPVDPTAGMASGQNLPSAPGAGGLGGFPEGYGLSADDLSSYLVSGNLPTAFTYGPSVITVALPPGALVPSNGMISLGSLTPLTTASEIHWPSAFPGAITPGASLPNPYESLLGKGQLGPQVSPTGLSVNAPVGEPVIIQIGPGGVPISTIYGIHPLSFSPQSSLTVPATYSSIAALPTLTPAPGFYVSNVASPLAVDSATTTITPCTSALGDVETVTISTSGTSTWTNVVSNEVTTETFLFPQRATILTTYTTTHTPLSRQVLVPRQDPSVPDEGGTPQKAQSPEAESQQPTSAPTPLSNTSQPTPNLKPSMTRSKLLTGTGSSSQPEATGVLSPVQPICETDGVVGNFVLDFDEGDCSVGPLFNPYSSFWFSEYFTIKSPGQSPYVASSGSQLAEFIPASRSQSFSRSSNIAQIGVGNQMSKPCFRFNWKSMDVGCEAGAPLQFCEFNVAGYRWNATKGSQDLVLSQQFYVPPCPEQKNCPLTTISGSDFENLTSIFVATTVEQQPAIWWLDNLQLGWSDNSCESSQCRAQSPQRVARREGIDTAIRKGIWQWTPNGLKRITNRYARRFN